MDGERGENGHAGAAERSGSVRVQPKPCPRCIGGQLIVTTTYRDVYTMETEGRRTRYTYQCLQCGYELSCEPLPRVRERAHQGRYVTD